MNPMIDDAIQRVERLYTTLTGAQPPHDGGSAPLPPEADPLAHVEGQLARMMVAAEQLVPQSSAQAWVPHGATWHDDEAYVVSLDVPGVARDQLELAIDGNVLHVRGRRRPPWSAASRVASCESALGDLHRSLVLPAPASSERVNARLADGVLVIRIEATKRGESSQIPVT